jgi:hypothetical protein
MDTHPSSSYPTSSNVKCFIGGYWVDDLHRIEARETVNKIPIQGYNQRYFIDVADGQSIVQGTITILYRYAKYLLSAIKTVTRQNDAPTDPKEKTRVVDTITHLQAASPEERVRILANAPKGQFDLYSELLDVAYHGVPNTNALSAVDLRPADTLGGFNIQTVYYDGASPYFAETLEGVHMLSRTKTISAGTGGGDSGGSGMPLYETYSFFARKIVETDYKRFSEQLKKLSDAIALLNVGRII